MDNKNLTKAVCCFFDCGETTILGRKSPKSKLGASCWNAYGGVIKPNETEKEAAVREVFEETGGVWVLERHLKKRAVIYFHNKIGEFYSTVKVTFFWIIQWGGEVKETEEMLTPTEFYKNDLPYDEMMPADKELIPLIMKGEKFKAHVFQDLKNMTVLTPLHIISWRI